MAHLPGWLCLATLLLPSLPWFTQEDFNTRGAGASLLLEVVPPSGQIGPSLTSKLL